MFFYLSAYLTLVRRPRRTYPKIIYMYLNNKNVIFCHSLKILSGYK